MTIYDMLVTRVDIAEYIGQDTDLIRQNDGSYRGKCPIHKGKNPSSLMVTPKNSTFYCNSCGAAGTVINYVQYRDNFSYNEAVELLADYANIDIKRDDSYQKQKSIFDQNNSVVRKYKSQISGCIDYLTTKRGLTDKVINEFDLGWNQDEMSIVIPIRDHQGRVIAFSRRFMFKEPKYRNSRNNDVYDKSKVLFNMDKARRKIKDRLYIVEGYMDAIAGHMQGHPTVAYCTSELSKDQIELIRNITHGNPNITIYLAPDNDKVGEDKLIKMRDKFLQIAPKMNVRVIKYPGLHWSEIKDENDTDYYKDFNDLVKNGINIGSLDSEQLDMYVLKLKLNTCKDEHQEYLVTEQFGKTISNPMVRADIAIYLSQRWNKELKPIRDLLDIAVTTQTDEDIVSMFKSVDQCLKDYKLMIETEGLTFGFPGLDTSIRGARPSDVVIFGAYSSVGKTFYAVEFAIHMAIRLKKNVMIFSLEMPSGAFMERIIASIMGVSTAKLEEMVKTSDKWLDVYDLVRNKLEEKIKIIDKNNISIQEIERMIKIANARMVWKEGNTDVVIVDYFQYMKNTHDFESASASARGMKAVAKENDVVLIMLSQLSRSGSPWERPTMQMLKSTGDLESSADIILMAHRPGLDPSLTAIEKENLKDSIIVHIAKARRGADVSDFEHSFDKEKTQIREV